MSPVLARDEVHAIAVGELFSPHADRYSIPLYQRNYTWGEEQIHRLVHDVLDEAERDDAKDYFLGNLVVAQPAGPHDPFDVIDGQQRLTTLYLLLTKLQSVPEVRSQVGDLHPLAYEARDKATRALRGLADGANEDEGLNPEDSGILRAVNIIEQLLQEPSLRARFLTPTVIDYLLNRVLIIRMPIDRTTDLNRYFEIMNTRGAQLSPVDIVKARLLRCLADPGDRALLNHVWTACSDMGRYVAMTATPGDTTWRSAVFGEEWEALPTADFAELRTQLVDWARAGGTIPDSESGDTSTAVTFQDAVAAYSRSDITNETDPAETDDRFTSQITFPTLLLHVLAVRGEGATGQDDRQLDDKLLVSRFANRLESLASSEQASWVRRFTTDLLRTRHLFDQYILKRDATLTTGHESTTDEEPGTWSLYRLSRGTYQGRGDVRYAPRYPSTFADDESRSGAGSLHRRILLLQSALRITFTSPRTMHWITDALSYATLCADRGEQITAQGMLDRLESFALARLDEALRPKPGPDPDDSLIGPDGLPLGFAIPRIVYTYLDYLLVEELGEWDFVFSYRTSVEHFSPGTEDSEHVSEAFHVRDRRLLDWLGNLALVTVSTNSKFSNYLPAEKANNHAARRQSLKLELMARQAKAGSWNDQDIRVHHEKMVKLLRDALARKPSSSAAQPVPMTSTERHTP